MIKVLELINDGYLGGGQTHILSILNSINRNAFDLIVSASPIGEFKTRVLDKKISFADITISKIYRKSTLQKLINIVEQNKIDVIHSHGGVAGVYARKLKQKLNRIKVVHTIHGIHYINSKNIFRSFFSKQIEQNLVPYTDTFICVSESDFKTASQINIIDTNKTVVIKNGIDLKKFYVADLNTDLASSLGINKGDIVIGNISRFDYQKNQRFMLNSAKKIMELNPKVKLLLVGDGIYLNECKAIAQKYSIHNQTIFTGEVTNVESYYPLIDIFVFPSMWEGFSITLIEAMASGRSIIASNIPPNNELIKNNYSGLLFDLNESDSFITVINRLLQNEYERTSLSQNALLEAKQYDEREMVRKIENIYRQLI